MKYITMPDGHNYDQANIKLLETIDNGLDNAVKNAGTHKLQEQINHIFKKIDPLARVPLSTGNNSQDRKIAGDYMRAVLKNDKELARNIMQKETIWPSHVLHTGGNNNIDSGSMVQGGYLIPELLHNEIARIIEEAGVARREMRFMPFAGAGNERRLPVENSEPDVYWVQEGEKKPATKPTIGQVTQELKKLAAICILTDELIADAGFDLISYLSQRFADVLMLEEDKQFFAGTGTPWTGLINASGVIPVSMGVGKLAADLTPDDLLNLKYSIPAGARRGAKFYMNSEMWAHLRGYRASAVINGDSEGAYLVQSPTAGAPPLLWGSPVVEVDALPGIADVTNPDEPFLVFSNLQKTCVYGDKNSTQIKVLDQATVTDTAGNSINLAERDMSAVRIVRRTGFVPLLPSGIAVMHSGPIS